jgi:hypothetical protein
MSKILKDASYKNGSLFANAIGVVALLQIAGNSAYREL